MSIQPINSPTTWKRAQTSINANFTALVNALAGEGTVDATDPVVTALLTDNGSGAYAAVEGIVEDVADAVIAANITNGTATPAALDPLHRDERPINVMAPAYGARPNESTGTSDAFQSALSDAVSQGRPLYIPGYGESDPWLLDESVTFALTAEHNGVTIMGDGPSTVLKMTGGHSAYTVVQISESAGALENIHIHGLMIDGNKAANGSAVTGFGIFASRNDGSGTADARGLTISDVWAHDCVTTGVNIFMSNVLLSNVHSWDHGMHGFGFREGHDIVLIGAHAWGCGQYGFDISQNSHVTVIGGSARGCTNGGMKATVNTEARLHGLILSDNTGAGLTTTGAANLIELHGVTAEGNGAQGFRFADGTKAVRGSYIRSVGNTGVGVYLDLATDAVAAFGVVDVLTNGSHGWHQNLAEAIVGSLIARGNGGHGAFVAGGYLAVNGGRVSGNTDNGLYPYNASVLHARGVKFATDTNQTSAAVRFANTASGSVTACDFTGVTSGSKVAAASGTSVRLRDNTGLVTSNRGMATITNGTTSVVVTHGLAFTPQAKDITLTPLGSPSGHLYVTSITSTQFTINITAAPGSDLSVGWAANYDQLPQV